MSLGGTDIHELSALRALGALTLATAGVLVVLVVAGGIERAAAGTECANADATITDSADKLRNGLICLINEDRREKDRHSLDPNGKLREAAGKHNRTMQRKNCWAHECPGEPSLGKRIRNSGYLDGARRWRYAENFGCAVTPNALVHGTNGWLENDFQRQNIRNSVFRDIGVGVLKGQVDESDCNTGNEVTYTVNFGRRKG